MSVLTAVNELIRSLCSQFVQGIADGCIESGGAVSVHGAQLKANR